MAKKEKLVRTSLTISMIIILSKAVGFLRSMVITSSFGRSVEASAYQAAYNYLSLFTLLFTVGVSSAFIPIYARKRLSHGENGANRYASNVMTLYILLGLLAGVAGWFLCVPLSHLTWRADVGRELVVQYSRSMFPFLVFFAISGVLTNILNARERFIPEQLMGFALSICCITASLAFKTVSALAIATGVTGILQVLMLLPFAKGNFSYRPRLSNADGSLGSTFRIALPALVGMAFDEVNHLFDKAVTTSVDATGLVPLTDSYLLVMFVLGVLVVPITTIMFSRLSKFAARGDTKSMAENVAYSIELIGFITLPIIAVFMVAGADIFSILFERGAWSAQDTLYTAPILACYMLGVFTFGARNFLVRVYYSLQDTRTPMRIGIAAVLINIALNYTLAITFKMGVKGVSLATSISGACGALCLLGLLPRKLNHIAMREICIELLKTAAAALAAYFIMSLIHSALGVLGTGLVMRIARVGLMGIGGMLAYLLIAICLKAKSTSYITTLIKK